MRLPYGARTERMEAISKYLLTGAIALGRGHKDTRRHHLAAASKHLISLFLFVFH